MGKKEKYSLIFYYQYICFYNKLLRGVMVLFGCLVYNVDKKIVLNKQIMKK